MRTLIGNKILIVDDESSIRKVLYRVLTEAGYLCKAAEDVPSAKKLLETDDFNLIISDLKMPNESGLELLKHAKEHYPHIGRVMVTAFSSQDIATQILDVGVYGYLIKPMSQGAVLITVENALRHLALDLAMLSSKSEVEQRLVKRTKTLNVIMDNLNVGVVMFTPEKDVVEANRKMLEWFPDARPNENTSCNGSLCKNESEVECLGCPLEKSLKDSGNHEFIKEVMTFDGLKDFRVQTSPVLDGSGAISGVLGIYEDITERLMIERDLNQAQKLEAVGQLAAGIAHEINTPVQYVGDNIHFLKDSFEDITSVLECYSQKIEKLDGLGVIPTDLKKEIEDALEDADLEYLNEEIPNTLSQSIDGMKRVEKIVRAMKDFSHPGDEDKVATDINKLLESTVTVCKNEWKYVAEMDLDLASNLPLIPCFSSEISQAFLNIIVNGAHAISDINQDGAQGKGTIAITTELDDDAVVIKLSDSGSGVPEKIKEHIFEPFFTTKERGKGTGQGLAIAYRVIKDRHEGNLSFETEEGKGTTFIIRLLRDS